MIRQLPVSAARHPATEALGKSGGDIRSRQQLLSSTTPGLDETALHRRILEFIRYSEDELGMSRSVGASR
jgi:hypothetical protein